MFSQDLYQRVGLRWDKWAGCSACRIRRKKKKWKRGRGRKGFGKTFFSPSTLSIYRSSIHTPTYRHTHTHTQPTRQSQDVTSSTGREAKQLFLSLLLSVLLSEVGASWSVSGRQRKSGSRRAKGGGTEQLGLSSTGSLKSRGPVPESSLNFPQLSTTFQTLRCRITARYSPDNLFSIL